LPVARLVALFLAFVCTTCVAAEAHPLGNFTSNHMTRLDVGSTSVVAHYVLDDAEIPTFSLLRSLDANGRPSSAILNAWAAHHAAEIAPQLVLSIDGKAEPWTLVDAHAVLRPGAAGLSTLYFTADYRAPRPPGAARIEYDDTTLAGRIGWRDVVVSPATEPTRELRAYPNALIGSPRDRTATAIDVSATGVLRVADVTAAPIIGTSAARMNDLSDVLARNLADPLILGGALLIALALGALHALEPGHGKTLLAISLVGARATVPQAAILAVALTLAHTLGVLVFGVVVLALARYIVPEAIYPWIALASGLFVAYLGARALAREIARRRSPLVSIAYEPAAAHAHDAGHAHDHGHAQAHHHAHDHHHHGHDHGHDHVHTSGPAHAHAAHTHAHAALDDEAHARAHAIPGSQPLRFREALIAATSGNVAPCPAALVVLLAAIATNRVGYGLVLIVAFSIGLALTLTLLGVAVVRGASWLTQRPQFDRFAKLAPLVTASVISVIGAWMIGEAAVAQQLVASPAPIALAVLFLIAAITAARTLRRGAPAEVLA
jgi:ABC-type nickel/cobalt efflux system permease component RcnA